MATSSRDVEERLTRTIEGIIKKLETFDAFKFEVSRDLGSLNSRLNWIKAIGAFLGTAVIAGAGSLLYMSNRAGHVEEAVSILRAESKEKASENAKILAAIASIEKRMAQETPREPGIQ